MELSNSDRARILSFYRDSFARFNGESSKQVRWWSEKAQKTRFEILSQIDNLEGKSILDAGCGMGDLYEFLKGNYRNLDYTGIDLIPEFITQAQAKFPDGKFICLDVSEVNKLGKFDYVFASGSLTFKVSDNLDFYKDFIKQMFGGADLGIGFNMLREDYHTEDEVHATYSPKEIADYCATITPKIQVMIDYLPDDFTVFMYR